MGSLCEREPDAFRFVTPNQSHACEQVATGRWNPYPPPLATIETSELAILSVSPPGANAEGSDGFALRTTVCRVSLRDAKSEPRV